MNPRWSGVNYAAPHKKTPEVFVSERQGGEMCQSNMTALLGEAALFSPGYEWCSSVVPCDRDRLISGYRLTQTALRTRVLR